MLQHVTRCYTMLYHVTACKISPWFVISSNAFHLPLQKLLDTMYSDTPELRKRPAEPEYGLLGEYLQAIFECSL